jgi:hypothetical protein
MILVYNVISYGVFRGKVRANTHRGGHQLRRPKSEHHAELRREAVSLLHPAQLFALVAAVDVLIQPRWKLLRTRSVP